MPTVSVDAADISVDVMGAGTAECERAGVAGARLRGVKEEHPLSLRAVELLAGREFRHQCSARNESGERDILLPRLQRLARCGRIRRSIPDSSSRGTWGSIALSAHRRQRWSGISRDTPSSLGCGRPARWPPAQSRAALVGAHGAGLAPPCRWHLAPAGPERTLDDAPARPSARPTLGNNDSGSRAGRI